MTYRNPTPTVDIIIELRDRPHRPIVLIERRHAPLGWALPGGFVEYGESVEAAACREAQEETQLPVTLIEQFYVYSDPQRDPRRHTLSVVFILEFRLKRIIPLPSEGRKMDYSRMVRELSDRF